MLKSAAYVWKHSTPKRDTSLASRAAAIKLVTNVFGKFLDQQKIIKQNVQCARNYSAIRILSNSSEKTSVNSKLSNKFIFPMLEKIADIRKFLRVFRKCSQKYF
jgi:hypothetical protein